jgi:N,N-dimethylformamidase
MKTVPLSGYTDTISGRPGHKIEFKVSSESKLDYKARLYRSINADPNPSLGGLNETECDHIFKPMTVKSRIQKFFPGSYGKTLDPIQFRAKNSIKFSCRFFPTLIKNKQCLISLLGSTLEITEKGYVNLPIWKKR